MCLYKDFIIVWIYWKCDYVLLFVKFWFYFKVKDIYIIIFVFRFLGLVFEFLEVKVIKKLVKLFLIDIFWLVIFILYLCEVEEINMFVCFCGFVECWDYNGLNVYLFWD